MGRRILGISAFYHDSAAALVVDGEIVAAAQEERFTRRKHDPGFPAAAVAYCLREGGLQANDLDEVVFYDRPKLKFDRLLATYSAFAPKGFGSFRAAMGQWLGGKLWQEGRLRADLAGVAGCPFERPISFTTHHLSHAASAFFPSPFEEAVILTVDGVGEWATATVGVGRGNQLRLDRELRFPHSLGLLYSAFTDHTGFRVNSGEYKVMGLAPYGRPVYADLILRDLMDLKDDGSFRLDQRYFNYCTGFTMTNARFDAVFGPPRHPEQPLEQRHMDLAASVQAVTEQILLRMTRSLAKEYGIPNLCLAGGVALNCVANGHILRDGAFRDLWVQPAAGDAGGAVGAALAAHHLTHGAPRRPVVAGNDSMKGAYLGPTFAQDEIEDRLTAVGACWHRLSEEDLLEATVDALLSDKAVGWFQGRMEFGPRALGARSILGNPCSPSMQRTLNLKIKYRESFRPFAPSVLAEDVGQWFDLDRASPYMLLVAQVAAAQCRKMDSKDEALFGIDKLNVIRSTIPAVTHVDYSARVQTVHRDTNPRYHRLLSAFKRRTGCSVLVNTSFNVRGEPIVCTPEDAFRCFMGTEMEALAIGDCLLLKEEQDPALAQGDYKEQFVLD
jgi:carbamoyltransferase